MSEDISKRPTSGRPKSRTKRLGNVVGDVTVKALKEFDATNTANTQASNNNDVDDVPGISDNPDSPDRGPPTSIAPARIGGRPAMYSTRDDIDETHQTVAEDSGDIYTDEYAGGETDESGEEQENEDDVNEVVVLDPKHRLMKRFQARLKKHLDERKEKVTNDTREVMTALKNRKKEREDIGVQLHGLQLELARYQALLEKFHDEHGATQLDRQTVEAALMEVRKTYAEKQARISEEKKREADLRTEVENVSLRLFYMMQTKQEVQGDVAVMKRAAERALVDNTKAELEKRAQDLFVDRMVGRLDRLREDIAMHEAQIAAQMEETRVARDALSEANMEIDAINVEKKQLFLQWSSSLVGMRRRDEAHAAMVAALHEQEQRILTLESELNVFKKSISKEQEQNERLMANLSKVEQDIATVRKQQASSTSEHEALKVEYSTYSKILKETEEAFSKVNLERALFTNQLNSLRKEIEKAYEEKVRLEDTILAAVRDKLTLEKAAQYTEKIIGKIRERTKELENQVVTAENDIAKTLLETAHLESRIDAQQKIKNALDEEMKQKNDAVIKSQTEINKRTVVVQGKQNQLDMLTKKLDAMKAASGGQELSPQELMIKSLTKSIAEERLQLSEQQQAWLREQAQLVELCRTQDERSQEVEMLKKQVTILTQKKIRLESEVDTQRREIGEIDREISAMQTDILKLNQLIFRERGSEDSLQKDNSLMESKFMRDLRAAEKDSIEMEERLESSKEEKEKLLNSLVEAERQIMWWEKKMQLAKETKATIDADVGQGDIFIMKAEIHRMQVRLQQLTREQEKMVCEMEKTVDCRDIIAVRGDAVAKTAGSGKGPVTRGGYHKQIAEVKKKIKQMTQAAIDSDAEIVELRRQQQEMSSVIDERQKTIQSLQSEADIADNRLDELTNEKARMLADLISKQHRSKYYQQLAEGKYTRLCKTEQTLEAERQKQLDRMHALVAIVDRLSQDYPQAQQSLQKVIIAYGTKVNPQQQ